MQDPSQPRIELNREPFHSGGWHIEPLRNILTREAQQVHLEPKVMDVLVCLARHKGSVVSKEELIRDVWENRFVTDDVITVSIHELRKALGDSARQPKFVETIPRRGYRWVADVSDTLAALTAPPVEHSGSGPQRARNVRRWLAAAAVLFAAASAVGWLVLQRATLSRAATHVPAPLAEAAYRKGRALLDERSGPAHSLALVQFEEAARIDPQFAEAYAAIAHAAAMTADSGFGDRAPLHTRAREAIRQALQLNPNLAAAHAASGVLRLVAEWDFPGAEESLRRAIELRPSLMEAHQAYAWVLSATGRHMEAVAEARLAAALDPHSPMRHTEVAWALAYSERYAEAIVEIDRALALNPQYFQGHLSKGMLFELLGNTREAYTSIRSAYSNHDRTGRILRSLDANFRADGLRGVYRGWLRVLQANPSTAMPRNEVWRASLHSRVGDVDEAIAALRRAYDRREGALAWMRVNPSFMPLRYDPRFQDLVQRVGLAR